MAALGRGAPMIPRNQTNGFDFVRIESAQVAVLDQIVGVVVMPFVADMDADVVKDCRVLEPFALTIGQSMDRAGLIEERRREPCDLHRVLGPVIAALRELDDAST